MPPKAGNQLKARQVLFRDSIKDLALYLGKMSGTTVEIIDALPAGDKRVPVYVGFVLFSKDPASGGPAAARLET